MGHTVGKVVGVLALGTHLYVEEDAIMVNMHLVKQVLNLLYLTLWSASLFHCSEDAL